MSDQGWIVRGPRWWLIVRLVGAIVWALALLFDIAWKLVVGFPAGPDSLAGGARWLVLACEGFWAVALGDWAWLAWRRRLRRGSEPSGTGERMALIDRLVEGPQAWRDLGHAGRRDVLHHARQGRPYPDPEVAAIAVQWARRVRSKPLWWRLLRGVGMAVVVYSAVGGVIAAGIWALPGSTVDMEHGLWPVVRTAGQLSTLAGLRDLGAALSDVLVFVGGQ